MYRAGMQGAVFADRKMVRVATVENARTTEQAEMMRRIEEIERVETTGFVSTVTVSSDAGTNAIVTTPSLFLVLMGSRVGSTSGAGTLRLRTWSG
jgi:hypothetical protein